MTKTAYYKAFATIEIVYTDSHIIRLSTCQEQHSAGERSALSDLAFGQISEYLDGKRQIFDFPYRLIGTDFQKSVWQALCGIPYGQTRTYKEVASAIGKPLTVRAVGMACSKNPIWIAVPCHRVIGSDGRLTGYAGGIDMKRKLLFLESGQGKNCP